jgi:hypothetical protein
MFYRGIFYFNGIDHYFFNKVNIIIPTLANKVNIQTLCKVFLIH